MRKNGGDAEGARGDELETIAEPVFLAQLETKVNDTQIKTVPMTIQKKGFKIYAEGITAGTSTAITGAATIKEQRAA